MVNGSAAAGKKGNGRHEAKTESQKGQKSEEEKKKNTLQNHLKNRAIACDEETLYRVKNTREASLCSTERGRGWPWHASDAGEHGDGAGWRTSALH